MSDFRGDKQRCFIDTNVWLYAFIATQDAEKSRIAKSIVQDNEIVVSTQIINEVSVNLLKKATVPEEQLQELIVSFYHRFSF